MDGLIFMAFTDVGSGSAAMAWLLSISASGYCADSSACISMVSFQWVLFMVVVGGLGAMRLVVTVAMVLRPAFGTRCRWVAPRFWIPPSHVAYPGCILGPRVRVRGIGPGP